MPVVNLLLLGHFDGEYVDDLNGIGAEAFEEVRPEFAQHGLELAHAQQRGAGPDVIQDFINVSAQLQPAINDIGTLATVFGLALAGARSTLRRRAERKKQSQREGREQLRVRVFVFGSDVFYVQGDASLLDLDEPAFQAMLRGLHIPRRRFGRGRQQYQLLWREGAFWLRLDRADAR